MGALTAMPKRYGGIESAVWLGIALVIGSLLLWAAFNTGLSKGVAKGEYEANSDTYASHAEQDIQRRCFRLDPTASKVCIRDVIDATNESERAERDLVAQSDMARWALWMLIVTAAMTVATGIGVVFVWRTLLATQMMAADTREIGEAQVRAYLSCVGSRFIVDSKGQQGVVYMLANSGQSPAVNVSALVRVSVNPRDSDTQIQSNDLTPILWGDIPAGQTRELACKIFSAMGKKVADATNITIATEISYRTVFSKSDLKFSILGGALCDEFPPPNGASIAASSATILRDDL